MPASNMDKFIDNVILVILPNTKYQQYRWIVRKREDGRYIVRTPKNGVRVGDLKLKRDKDYGKESLLPKGSKPYYTIDMMRKMKRMKKSKSKSTKLSKNTTRKNK
jgi:hypothetical protein